MNNGGFIDEYVNVVSQITDAPPLFIRASAYWLTSLLFGVNVVCPLATIGTTRVNVWFMLAGPSGITRKSTIIHGLAKKFFSMAFSKYLVNKLGIDEKEAWKISQMVFIEKATPEGLADHIQLTYGGSSDEGEPSIDRYSIISTEFGGILKLCERDYMSGYIETLSKLYYGEGDIYYLSARRVKNVKDRVRQIPEGLYVCALVGIQRLSLYLKPEFFEQGLLRRFIIVCQNVKDKTVRRQPLDPMRRIYYTQFEELVDDYIKMVENYNQFDVQTQRPIQVFVRMGDDVRSKINEYWDQCETEYMRDTQNLWLLYRQSTWEHLLKLTILEAIARTPTPTPKFGDLEIKVEMEDYEKAFAFLSKVLARAQVEISAVEARPVTQSLPTSSGKLNFIYSIIESAGQEGISRSDLLVQTGLLKDELKRLIVTLMEQERIVAYKFVPPKGGRSQIRFFAKRYEKYLLTSGGQPIAPETLEVIW